MSLELAGFEKNLAPGGQIETPKAFMAPFSGGVDELGNQLLDCNMRTYGVQQSRIFRQDALGSRLAGTMGRERRHAQRR